MEVQLPVVRNLGSGIQETKFDTRDHRVIGLFVDGRDSQPSLVKEYGIMFQSVFTLKRKDESAEKVRIRVSTIGKSESYGHERIILSIKVGEEDERSKIIFEPENPVRKELFDGELKKLSQSPESFEKRLVEVMDLMQLFVVSKPEDPISLEGVKWRATNDSLGYIEADLKSSGMIRVNGHRAPAAMLRA